MDPQSVDIQGYDIDGEVIKGGAGKTRREPEDHMIHFQERSGGAAGAIRRNMALLSRKPPYGERARRKNLPAPL